jgi:hypothetical protein
MDIISECIGKENIPKKFKVITDTSDFFRVNYDDVVVLGGRPYLVRHNQREGRFGIDEQPKFWVKKAIDLIDRSPKIIKLTFLERFTSKVGGIIFECFRSPQKEARILNLVKGDERFMQGFSVNDDAGNIVRILDFINGRTFADYILTLGRNHEDYFNNFFPQVFDEYIELVRAIGFIHTHGEKHGDIRRDHILRDNNTGANIWIDFDFNYLHRENMFGYDLFGLGNILIYIAGRGDVTIQELKIREDKAFYNLGKEDMNIIFNNRVANLRKVFPYIPEALNMILLYFSTGAPVFYDNTNQFLNDIEEARSVIGS